MWPGERLCEACDGPTFGVAIGSARVLRAAASYDKEALLEPPLNDLGGGEKVGRSTSPITWWNEIMSAPLDVEASCEMAALPFEGTVGTSSAAGYEGLRSKERSHDRTGWLSAPSRAPLCPLADID